MNEIKERENRKSSLRDIVVDFYNLHLTVRLIGLVTFNWLEYLFHEEQLYVPVCVQSATSV